MTMTDEERWKRARIAAAAWEGWPDAERAAILAGKCDHYSAVQVAYAALRDADKPLADLTRHPFEAQARELLASNLRASRRFFSVGRILDGDSAWDDEIAAMCAAYDAGVAKGGAA